MEWTKETLANTAIWIKNVNLSNKILRFYQSFGYFLETKPNWKCPKNMVGGYIGPSSLHKEGIIHIYWPNVIAHEQIIIVPSKPRRKFPREMMTSVDGKIWHKRNVLGKIKSTKPFVVPIFSGSDYPVKGIEYAKEID